jgi:hypothetical protein
MGIATTDRTRTGLPARAGAAHDELTTAHAELTRARAFDEAVPDALPVAVVGANPEGRIPVINRVGRLRHGTDSDAAPPEEFAQRFTVQTPDTGEPIAPQIRSLGSVGRVRAALPRRRGPGSRPGGRRPGRRGDGRPAVPR